MVSCSRELFRRGACDETFRGERSVISICGKLDDFRCGMVPAMRQLSVAPANAGAHTPRPAEWAREKTTSLQQPSLSGGGLMQGVGHRASSMNHAVWVPAPVRNCALGRDDRDARSSTAFAGTTAKT